MNKTILDHRAYSPGSRPRLLWCTGCGSGEKVVEGRRFAVVGVLFIIVSPSDHVAIVPFTCADLDTERQAVGIETRRNAYGGHAQHVHPVRITVWAFGQAAVLQH